MQLHLFEPVPHDRLPASSFHDRLHAGPTGLVTMPGGLHKKLTTVVRRGLRRYKSERSRVNFLAIVNLHFQVTMTDDEEPDALMRDSVKTAKKRMVATFRRAGYDCDPKTNAGDGDFIVKPKRGSKANGRALVAMLRQFHALLATELWDGESPGDIRGWHALSYEKKLEHAVARGGSAKTVGSAGSCFHWDGGATPSPYVYDPLEAGDAIEAAVLGHGRPETICDIVLTAGTSGTRSMVLLGNALGWAQRGLGDGFMFPNKNDDAGAMTALAQMPAEVRMNVERRFRDAAHPHDPDKTMRDHIEELWLDGGDRAYAELAAMPLFPHRPGKFWSYHGLYYHARSAIDAREVKVRSGTRMRRANLHDLRRCSMSADVKELYESTEDPAERIAGKVAIGEAHGHTDPASIGPYIKSVELNEAVARRQKALREKGAEKAARRSANPAPLPKPRARNRQFAAALSLMPPRERRETAL